MTTALDAARELYDTVDANAAEASTEPVPQTTVDAFVDKGLHAIAAPRAVGGGELSLVDQIDVYAEVARADGSAGWCLMANAVTIAFFGAWAGDGFVEQVFADGVPLAAGQFAPNGVAVADDGGYRVTGDYQFGSGVRHSSWVGAGTLTQPDDGSDPQILFALMPADQVELEGNWDVLGLQSTASWDYAVRDVWVPADATFDFFAPVRRRGGPVFDLGVMCLTAAGHAGFALGVARRVIDELRAVARDKHRMGAATPLRDSDRFLVELGTIESRHRAAAAWVREAFTAVEAPLTEDGGVDLNLVNLARQATVFATHECADVAREAYLLAGTSALRNGPIERGFRDLHAGTQHFFASPAATVDFGRDLLSED
jgi:alkylation response protein AidB-like acyl-CoA dehydrogenase